MKEPTRNSFDEIVRGGAYENYGMGQFDITAEDAERIKNYVLYRANADRKVGLGKQSAP